MKSIVVVEDNRDNRLLVREIIGGQYELVEYATGFEAMVGLQERTPDLILLDISLSGMDGVEVLLQIRSLRHLRDVPVVALTAHAMSGDRERYLTAGFNHYVAKPIVDEEAFVSLIENVLNGTRSSADA